MHNSHFSLRCWQISGCGQMDFNILPSVDINFHGPKANSSFLTLALPCAIIAQWGHEWINRNLYKIKRQQICHPQNVLVYFTLCSSVLDHIYSSKQITVTYLSCTKTLHTVVIYYNGRLLHTDCTYILYTVRTVYTYCM